MLYRTATVPGPVLRGPGVVGTVAAIDALVAAGARRIDLGIGQEAYKLKFSPVPTPSTLLVVAPARRWQPVLTASVEGRRLARERSRALRRRVAGWRGRAAPASASDPAG